jgi:sulfate transport system ATP-binding protein
MSIGVRDITKHYGAFAALDRVSLDVPEGKLVALLGPSGSGKTTLLRIIAGLETPDEGSGSIFFHGEDTSARKPAERQVGFVFQHYALFRHMSAFENVAFGLRVRPRATRPSEREIQERVHDLLTLVQLDTLADRLPSQLSGGQRQRVALARALAVDPRVLLLDEPFGALDARVRQELREWLRRLHDEIGVTSLFVTHDQEEALEVADLVVVMNEGRVQQVGTPDEVFHRPASRFVLEFMGHVNLFHGRVDGGEPRFDARESQARPSKVFARPHQLEIAVESNGKPCFPARVRRIHAAGPHVRLELESAFGPVRADLTHERFRALNLRADSTVYVSLGEFQVFEERA